MPVLPEGPIWFQHSSLKRAWYDPADANEFYKYLLLEVVVNKPTYFKQGNLSELYHSRTIEHTIGYEDDTRQFQAPSKHISTSNSICHSPDLFQQPD
jgi:hypothetical protein